MSDAANPASPGTNASAIRILRYFAYDHLPPDLRSVSEHFYNIAAKIAHLPATDPAEQTVVLRKLLEAKDAAVRMVLPLQKD